jgi:plastocyanin
VIAVALAASGCGGDDDEGAPAPEGAGARPAERAATSVDLDDFSIKPKELTVSSGETIEAKNVGAMAHNLTIERGPDASKPTEELAATSTFSGGQSDTVKVDLEPGRYALVCTVSGHREQGMVGSLTVR